MTDTTNTNNDGEACPVDLPEQPGGPTSEVITVVTSTGGAGSSSERHDEQAPGH